MCSSRRVQGIYGTGEGFMRMMRTATALSLTLAVPALLCCGASFARADEISDLRANQELLQSRIDQLAQQVSPTTEPGAPRFTPAAGAPSIAGSFPRSFLVPGTDVSLRVGGQGVGSVVWYIKGSAVGGALNG